MKKIFLTLGLMFAVTLSANAATTTNWSGTINTVGANIIKKNGIPPKISFKIVEDTTVNAYTDVNQVIYINTGLLAKIENNDELAAIIGHEIGHIVNSHIQRQSIISAFADMYTGKITDTKTQNSVEIAKELSQLKFSRSDEYEADLTGVDVISKAGYNPLAMISILNKISENYVDVLADHPSGDKRTMYIYDYLTYNYPTAVKTGFTTGSYKSFVAYAQPTVALRNSNAKKLAKFNKTQAKLKEKRLKRAVKMVKSSNGWSTSYAVLKSLTATDETSSSSSEK